VIVDSTPYPWPFTGAIDPAATALVICGSGPEWSGRTPLDPDREDNLARLRSLARRLPIPTVLVRHARPNDRRATSLPLAPSPVLDPDTEDLEVHAAGIDGFFGSSLASVLRRRGRTHLLVAGRGFETAVHSTLRRANDDGFECLTIHDACSPIDAALTAASISSIEMSGGIFGAVASTDAVIAAFSPFLTTSSEAPS
jgi:nicotinamidase-related amidase